MLRFTSSMLKRTFNLMNKTEAGEYEKWTKEQLIAKVKELEHQLQPSQTAPVAAVLNVSEPLETEDEVPKKKKKKTFDFSQHNTRFVALRFAYLGWSYSGLAYQFEPTPKPTIEEELLRALHMAKLIEAPDPAACKFSRCGRTDKGVSAMNQVISLRVRSKLSDEEHQDSAFDNKEIPYISILNSLLPQDIRITSACLRPPPDFDARFSCNFRHYRYLFRKQDLDIDRMNEAARLYEGTHDFRNFCKIDGSKQITNYVRSVKSATIENLKDDYYYLDLKGSAFLWHQVRCMMAILFLVGQKLEQPKVVEELLDLSVFPTKPQFEMANDIPLILYDCSYDDIEWKDAIDFKQDAKLIRCYSSFKGLATDYQIKAAVATIMEDILLKDADKVVNLAGCGTMNVGNGSGRNFAKYVKLSERDLGESFEVVNAKHKAKKRKRTEERARLAAEEASIQSIDRK